MKTYTREFIQNAYVRVCQDSGFQMDWLDAAGFTARLLGMSPVQIWTTFGSLDIMKQIARGEHPVCQKG